MKEYQTKVQGASNLCGIGFELRVQKEVNYEDKGGAEGPWGVGRDKIRLSLIRNLTALVVQWNPPCNAKNLGSIPAYPTPQLQSPCTTRKRCQMMQLRPNV